MASTELIVLIMRDGALRSALIGRLTLQGESLMTVDAAPDGPLVRSVARQPCILVIDGAALGDRLQRLVDSRRWDGIIVIDAAAVQPAGKGRLRIVRPERALAEVSETLAQWREASAGSAKPGE